MGTIQTCETDEDLDTQIEVFDGNSCDDDDDDTSGVSITFPTEFNQVYTVIISGDDDDESAVVGFAFGDNSFGDPDDASSIDGDVEASGDSEEDDSDDDDDDSETEETEESEEDEGEVDGEVDGEM